MAESVAIEVETVPITMLVRSQQGIKHTATRSLSRPRMDVGPGTYPRKSASKSPAYSPMAREAIPSRCYIAPCIFAQEARRVDLLRRIVTQLLSANLVVPCNAFCDN